MQLCEEDIGNEISRLGSRINILLNTDVLDTFWRDKKISFLPKLIFENFTRSGITTNLEIKIVICDELQNLKKWFWEKIKFFCHVKYDEKDCVRRIFLCDEPSSRSRCQFALLWEPWSQVFGLKVINERYLSKESLWAVLSASDHPQTFSGDFYDVFDSFERWW